MTHLNHFKLVRYLPATIMTISYNCMRHAPGRYYRLIDRKPMKNENSILI